MYTLQRDNVVRIVATEYEKERLMTDGFVEIESEPISKKAIEDMTLPELKEYAAEHRIDLGEAKKKDEILAVIEADNGNVSE
ncbi:hypothetical protein [Paenibacillus elgii]|uniref:hypothetical protein n=1 Tax=Paenibacillus elgii TaxID=189691 RepID=UPI00203DE5A1|nr:hypothetical protein [Paenibacillus elgii]MCM3273666.1 hypothetical protein [Paenibacillus elgii]